MPTDQDPGIKYKLFTQGKVLLELYRETGFTNGKYIQIKGDVYVVFMTHDVEDLDGNVLFKHVALSKIG